MLYACMVHPICSVVRSIIVVNDGVLIALAYYPWCHHCMLWFVGAPAVSSWHGEFVAVTFRNVVNVSQ